MMGASVEIDRATAPNDLSGFERELGSQLEAIRNQGLYRELVCIDSPTGESLLVNDKTLLNFSSNDYLGLANHPSLRVAAIEAVHRYGAGAAASRLICGSLRPHHELDEAIAAFKATEAALAFSTGYAAAVGAICAVVGKEDMLVVDKLIHASIVDAARLSGAKLRVFRHNDLNHLEKILRWADALKSSAPSVTGPKRRILIVTESVFSMDGDCAPLPEIIDLKDRYGCWLMVDEAHATGLYGLHRRGRADELGLSSRIEIQMGTLGKALGASGGYICGCRQLIDLLVNRARSFIFSTAPVPAAAAAATAGIRLTQSPEGGQRCATLWRRVYEVQAIFEQARRPSPILPVIVGAERKAADTAAALRTRGIFIPAIRYPTVARGQARLRLTVTANHGLEAIQQLRDAWSSMTEAHP